MACNRHGAGIRDCIPQPDSDDTLDALSNRPMMQLKFRVIRPGDFRMVVNQTIDVSGTIPRVLRITPIHEVAGIRWYELQKTVRSRHWSIRQQGTYAPQPLTATQEINLLRRWMGSIAIDRFGNIALGYSIVSDDADDGIRSGNEVYPGIRYTGRQLDDPLNLLFQGEKVIVQGAIPQGNLVAPVIPQRWGDYSALTVDPPDDCTYGQRPAQHVPRQREGSPPRRRAESRAEQILQHLDVVRFWSAASLISNEAVPQTVGNPMSALITACGAV
jgi:hypothetical protein